MYTTYIQNSLSSTSDKILLLIETFLKLDKFDVTFVRVTFI